MIEVRRATVTDLPWLRVLYAALVAEQQAAFPDTYPQMGGDADLDAFIMSVYRSFPMEDAAVFVATDEQRMIGFVGGEIITRTVGLPRRFAHAHYLYVAPAWRQQGVARALIAAGSEWIVSRGVETLECYGLAGDASWERRGFKPMMTRYYVSVAQLLSGRPPDAPAPPPKRKRGRPRKVQANGHGELRL